MDVQGVRLWAAPDSTRVVIDISAPVEYSLLQLSSPERVVIDLSNTRASAGLPGERGAKGVISAVRGAPRNGHDLRLVLDLNTPVRPKTFVLKPNAEYGHRLVIDLYPNTSTTDTAGDTDGTAPAVKKSLPQQRRELVIAIDAGHGGEDPGARGAAGTNEKDVVLAISRKLAALIDREPGMRAALIRTGDYYIGLRQRTQLARKHKADLFISIHADAFRNREAKGSSVYTLSQRGASSEAARWLAESENAADLIGGVSLDDKDDLLASVLLDLSQTATQEASDDVAGRVLTGLKGVGHVHKSQVQQAGFMVLKSPDIPSMLVETAFISNPHEERKLRDPSHQQRLATAIMNGIRAYFADHAPPGTIMAERRHVISPGETLSGIASQYRISTQRLRLANGLSNDRIQVGKVLRIPNDSDS